MYIGEGRGGEERMCVGRVGMASGENRAQEEGAEGKGGRGLQDYDIGKGGRGGFRATEVRSRSPSTSFPIPPLLPPFLSPTALIHPPFVMPPYPLCLCLCSALFSLVCLAGNYTHPSRPSSCLCAGVFTGEDTPPPASPLTCSHRCSTRRTSHRP